MLHCCDAPLYISFFFGLFVNQPLSLLKATIKNHLANYELTLLKILEATFSIMLNSFNKDIIPKNDTERLQVLEKYVVLNGYPDRYFNEVAQIIASTFQTQIALISFVGKTHVEFKGNFGMEGTNTTDRGVSLCSLAILDDNPTVFEDARKEFCLKDNPLVAGNFGLQFYAGVPLTTREGYNIGTVCVVDKKPRSFEKDELELLSKFAHNVVKELEARNVLKS